MEPTRDGVAPKTSKQGKMLLSLDLMGKGMEG